MSDATTAAARQEVTGSQITLEASGETGLRRTLRQEMRSVTQVAQALKKSVPGISVLRMPSHKVQAEGLLKAADAFITQASTYEIVLVEHALPVDFLQQLRDAAAVLEASIDGRGAARAGRVSATKRLALSLGEGTKFVKIIDAALTKALKTDPAKLAEWRNARRTTLVGVTSISTTQPVSIAEPNVKAA